MNEKNTSGDQEPAAPLTAKPLLETEGDEEVEKARAELLDLREKFLQLRENDLLSLREKVNSVSARLTIYFSILAILGVIVALTGLKQWSDFKKLVEETMNTKINDSVNYHDQVSQALELSNNGVCSGAIPLFVSLADKRPADELVFANATYCFIAAEDYEQGYNFIKQSEDKGFFPNKFQILLSQNNAGFILFARSLSDSKFDSEALRTLQRAEQIGRRDNLKQLVLPLLNLVFLYVARNDLPKAATYANEINALDNGPDWRQFQEQQWFKRLVEKRSDAKATLEKLLPKKKESTNSLSTK